MTFRESLRLIRKMARWALRRDSTLVPPPAPVKRWLLEYFARHHRLTTFVETGTFNGGTVFALRTVFARLITIELQPELCENARRFLLPYPHIHVRCGDSATLLPQALAELHEPALFWLDAHYSGGMTARGIADTPIMAELRAVFAHPDKHHVIAIDDAKDFGHGDYIDLDVVRQEAAHTGAYTSVQVAHNMIVISPRPFHIPGTTRILCSLIGRALIPHHASHT